MQDKQGFRAQMLFFLYTDNLYFSIKLVSMLSHCLPFVYVLAFPVQVSVIHSYALVICHT